MLTRGNQDVPFDGPPLVAMQIALTVGVAALSYHYIETPFRRHGMSGVRDAVQRWSRRTTRPARFAAASTAAAALAALAVAVAVLPGETPRIPGLTGIASAARGVTITATPEAREGADLPDERTAAGAKRAGKVLAVGDSVMLGASATLRKALPPGSVIDAARRPAVPRGRDGHHLAPLHHEAARGRHPPGQQRLRAVRRPRGADEAPARHAPRGAGDGARAAEVAGLGERRAGVRRRPSRQRRARRLARGVGRSRPAGGRRPHDRRGARGSTRAPS